MVEAKTQLLWLKKQNKKLGRNRGIPKTHLGLKEKRNSEDFLKSAGSLEADLCLLLY
jgi:hypothetical protein